MTIPEILSPAAILILWSLVVLMWVVMTRFPALARAGRDLSKARPGGRYVDIEKDMPDKVNWVSHNYTHLMEQPTLFYAVVAVLAVAGDSNETNVIVAWAYVILRIVHSLWQGLANIVRVRVILFALSTVCLWILAINAVRATVFNTI